MFAREVATAFEERGIAYCIVGGLAVNLYGIPRATYDIDLVVARSEASLRGCREALESLGLRCRLPLVLESLATESDEALAARHLVAVTFTDPDDPLREVDVLVCLPIPATELLARARLVEGRRLALPVASLADLVALKRAAGRPQGLGAPLAAPAEDPAMTPPRGYTYWVSDEQIAAYSALPIDRRVEWVEEHARLTYELASPEVRARWAALRRGGAIDDAVAAPPGPGEPAP